MTASYDGEPPHRRPTLDTLLDLLAEAVAANGDKTALSLRLDDGIDDALDATASSIAARARPPGDSAPSGSQPGDRLLTWSPSTPDLPATYFGAMRAGLILVPLDLRMSTEAVEGIVQASGARHLILGTGRDAPDPREAGLDRFPTTTVDAHRRGARRGLPARLGSADRRLACPRRVRHLRARLHLGHDRDAEGRDARPFETSSPRSRRSTGSSRGWSTGSSRSCRCRTCSSRRSGCSTRCRSVPTSCTSGAATRGSSSTRCATTG